MSDIRIAVVGAGHLGRIHASLLNSLQGVHLVAVVDPEPDARRQLAQQLQVTPLDDHRQLAGGEWPGIGVNSFTHHQIDDLLDNSLCLGRISREIFLHFNASDALSASQKTYATNQLRLFKRWYQNWSQTPDVLRLCA